MLNNIVCGDSYKLIKNIPDKSIDCIYIDVPYLIGKGGNIITKKTSALKKRIVKTDKELLNANIHNGFDYSILNEFVRILKNINCFIWCSKEQIYDILKWFQENTDSTYQILTWNKTNPTPMCSGNWLPDIEYCLYFNRGTKLNDGYELKSKYFISTINKTDKEKYKHPTIKPLELVKRHIAHTTQKGDIVLDCFSGSGTTCVAAKELNRQYIGIEIDPEYYRISLDRLNGMLANGQISFDTDINKL